ncbi:Hypothetical predicted protein [Paramuricea clavata]|uniref:Uncharacterized protein n=1 Tax=Paramuricea clavata TaxID=317549 RepID=A0A7D9L902_PARCT|nr:Hypothetical predicted protein [Paramuricea clavata]
MLEKLFQYIPRKSYNNFGNVVVLLFFLCGVFIIPIANDFDAKTNIRCSPIPKEISSSQNFVHITCFSKYEEEYHWKIPFGVLVAFNFAIVLTFFILYASWAKSRVARWDIVPNKEDRNEGMAETKNGILLFHIYILHLLFTRFFLLLLFAFAIFYSINFPSNFSCPWRSPLNTIPCVNNMATKKITLAKAVALIDVIFASLALAEVIFIFRWKRSDDEFCLVEDMEFCSVYILQRRENIGSIIRNIRNSPTVNTNFFVKLIIHVNRNKERHEMYDVHLDKLQEQIENIEDIFKPTNNQNNAPRLILIVGRPGIGKTELTKRIQQEWKKKKVTFWKGKLVIRLAFRKFNHENNKRHNLLTLFAHGDGVTPTARGQIFQDLYEFINLNQEKVIVVFDGLDELDVDLEKCWQEKEITQNDPKLTMSIFSLYVKLIRGNFLPNVTIVTTTRRTEDELYQQLNNFDKKLEILGFTESEIKEFVVKFSENNDELNTKTKQKKKGYMFEAKLPSNVIQLADIAKAELDQRKLEFELREDRVHLENCGLLVKIDDEFRNRYSFLHLTIQEYLAALHIFFRSRNNINCISEFLKTKVNEPRWHLVIQFLAGLIGHEIKKCRNNDLITEKRAL